MTNSEDKTTTYDILREALYETAKGKNPNGKTVTATERVLAAAALVEFRHAESIDSPSGQKMQRQELYAVAQLMSGATFEQPQKDEPWWKYLLEFAKAAK